MHPSSSSNAKMRVPSASRSAPYRHSVLLLFLAASSTIQTASAVFQVKLRQTSSSDPEGYCLASSSSSPSSGTSIELVRCDNENVESNINDRQLWDDGNGNQIRLKDTSLCASIDSNDFPDIGAGDTANVVLEQCDGGSDEQIFDYISDSSNQDAYAYVNFLNVPEMCITYDGSLGLGRQTIVEECDGSSSQQWDQITPPSSSARLVYLNDDCTECVGVNYDDGDGARIISVDCETADTEDKFWIIGNSDDTSWCLDVDDTLCVEEENSADLRLRDFSTTQNQEFTFNFGSNNDQIEASNSGRCVTMPSNTGGDVVTSSCSSSSDRQGFEVDDYNGWENDNCDGGGGNFGNRFLVYLNADADCDDCIGASSTSDGSVLEIVSCQDASSSRKYWRRSGSSGSQRWCLDSNTDLCVIAGGSNPGSGSDLLLDDDTSGDLFDFNSDFNSEIEWDQRNLCVERTGTNTITLQGCDNAQDQRWDKTDFNEWDSSCSGGGSSDSFLVYLSNNADCDDCIGVSNTQDDDELRIVSCENESTSRKTWRRFGSSGSQRWCLDSNTNLCVVEDGTSNRLKLTDGTGAEFDFNSNFGGEIQWDPNGSSNLCVEQTGTTSVTLQGCDGASSQSWDKTDFDEWDDTCDGGSSSSGEIIYSNDDCNFCIGVPSNPTEGTQITEVDCQDAPDEQKKWIFISEGTWCLEDNPSLCVDPSNSNRLAAPSSNQVTKWFRSGDEIQRWTDETCLSSADLTTTGTTCGGTKTQWTIQQDPPSCSGGGGRNPDCSQSGTIIALNADCNQCIARVGTTIGLVNCGSASDSNMRWNFQANTVGMNWCLESDSTACVGPTLTITAAESNQNDDWTYDDTTQIGSPAGENKIAQYVSPGQVIARSGSSSTLVVQQYTRTDNDMDFTLFDTPCDYQCFGTLSDTYSEGAASAAPRRVGAAGLFAYVASMLVVGLFVVN